MNLYAKQIQFTLRCFSTAVPPQLFIALNFKGHISHCEIQFYIYFYTVYLISPSIMPSFHHCCHKRQDFLPFLRLHSMPMYVCLCNLHVYIYACACLISCFSYVQLCVTLWTVAGHAPLSMEFSRQGNKSGLPCPPPGYLPEPRLELEFPAL